MVIEGWVIILDDKPRRGSLVITPKSTMLGSPLYESEARARAAMKSRYMHNRASVHRATLTIHQDLQDLEAADESAILSESEKLLKGDTE